MKDDQLPTEVDGVAVIAVEAVTSGLSTPSRPVTFTRQAKLLLENGEEVYGCRVCGHVEKSSGSLRGHVRTKHGQAKPPPVEWKDMPLGQVVAALQRLVELEFVALEWKTRALAAERDLATIRRAINGRPS